MDIDAIQQPSLEVHMDDDLINYDSDAVDYSLAADQDLGNGATAEAFEGDQASAKSNYQSGDNPTKEDPEHQPMDNPAQPIDATFEESTDEQHTIEQATETEVPLDADAADAALDSLTETVADEIDYGLGEVDYNEEKHAEVGNEFYIAEAVQGDGVNVEVDILEENTEISWEDDDADHVEIEAEAEKEGHEEEDQHSAQTEAVQPGDLTEKANAEAEETESRDHRQDELQALENVISWDGSMDAAGNLQPDNADSQFPTITVQYQGDEFPFLSSGSEGFFSELSILDDSMQQVFSGFRSQLKNEVTAEDELVFQIDELGLEFTESNLSHSLTMRQILEVFELLIKNEDPDGRRTLYTYLFTRVNSARRYDFLVESATAGKGLEEIQHLFSQHSFRNDSDADNADDSASTSEHAEGHDEEAYGHDGQAEQGDDDDHHDEDYEEYAKEDVEQYAEKAGEEHDEEYHEDSEGDHQAVDFFDEAVPEETEMSHADDLAKDADSPDNVDADEHDNNFAHEHSSTTSTLQGDADGTALADDETAVDAEAEGPVFVTGANDDAEIDWRDEDESELVGDGGSVTGKRSRDDNEEPDVDDEIDFKRRRP
ncbi:putative protein family UPF0646 [Cordyceps fumosorosea ARSEF 2679]|uniref:Uncharacterized protein n=1 Tax=Cordyceps fumosorosea (strain ARSEF 2679) TaxID=1081104 RepID=A0A167RP68_CORFA|nr:putative protein family UPF0646 [Cordyceps fumosorosea ARSEF 2679]OAA58790.1 putative protein family UPF0646 [Cordyceps fumosorosea ARSEF 2679]